MSPPSWDYKGCIVCVLVKDRPAGTGFIVAPELIVTCAHVIDAKAGDPPQSEGLSVRFAGAKDAESTAVELVPELWRSADKEDVAFLRCRSLPPAVSIARIADADGQQGQACQVFGYPPVGDSYYNGLGGRAEVVDHVSTKSGRRLIQLASMEITSGYSGAPLLDTRWNRVIGMAVEIIDDSVRELKGRHQNTAFAIPASVLKGIYGDLILETEALRKAHQEAVEQLKSRTTSEVQKSPEVAEQLAEQIQRELNNERPAKTKDDEKSAEVVATLFESPLSSVLDIVLNAYFHFADSDGQADQHAARTLTRVGRHIFPAIYDPEQLRQIRASIRAGQPFIVLPSTTLTIVEVLMAGTDGREAAFAGPLDPQNLPGGEYRLENPPESGIGQPDFFEDFEKALVEVLRVSSAFGLNSRRTINRALEIRMKRPGHRYYYVYSELPEPEVDRERDEVIRTLKHRFPSLVFIKRTQPADDMREFELVYQLQEMFGSIESWE